MCFINTSVGMIHSPGAASATRTVWKVFRETKLSCCGLLRDVGFLQGGKSIDGKRSPGIGVEVSRPTLYRENQSLAACSRRKEQAAFFLPGRFWERGL